FVEYGLILNSSKCRFFVQGGIFLGFSISENGIAADPAKVAAIRDRPKPSTNSEIRGFVNAAGYLRCLIKDFSKLAGPLTDQSIGPKNKPVTLSPESERSWLAIKDAMSSSPLVRKFDWRLPVVLETDASQKFLGAVLLQPHMHVSSDSDRSVLHPIAYFSRKLNGTQQRYSAQERELLGILLALQHWRHWVEGGDVTVITDHESLKTLHTKMEQPARIARFLDSIEHYGVRILYRKGKANVLADYLSRPPEKAFPSEENDNNSLKSLNKHSNDLETPISVHITQPEQLNRIDLQAIFEFLSQNQTLPPNLDYNWVLNNFSIYAGNLHRIKKNHTTSIGDPPAFPGTAVLLRVLEYEELVATIKRVHESQGHASVGTTM
ncbi:hypothetical protein K3495_g15819, partial [Podosphaera aphanis]